MRYKQEHYDIVVCGGGLAGFSAAIAAARQGQRTALIQDRPVLGGNSSSEVRVTPHGAARFHAYARETGIISELACEDRARNHEQFYNNGWTNSMWDMVLYDLAARTPLLTLFLNTSIVSVDKADGRTLTSVTGRIAHAETEVIFHGKVFIDCTGDGIVADLAGNAWRMGTESRAEFEEPHAPEQASSETMGSSLHFRAKDMGRPVSYEAPPWAVAYDDPEFFYAHNRKPSDIRAGYWWIELSAPWDTIHDAEHIRHELTRHVMGIWDWIKNKDPQTKDKASHYALDWVGQVPGKRESRRIMGRYLMTEHDPLNRTVFPDEVAYGGWYVDLHVAGGLLAPTSELPGAGEICGPYGIPLRILIAQDLDNLMMAGRNVSVTHAALGTVRVMSTTAIMGQAAGTAAAVAVMRGIPVPDVPDRAITEVQQMLLREGCFLPSVTNQDPHDLAREAVVTASSEAWSCGTEAVNEQEGELLIVGRSQWIAVNGTLDTLWVYLSNISTHPQVVEAALHPAAHIWDYRKRKGEEAFALAQLQVSPGYRGWVKWELPRGQEQKRLQQGYVRLDLSANPSVRWHLARQPQSGHPSAYEMDAGMMRSNDDGRSYSFRIAPPQPVHQATAVIAGATRPYQTINCWRSDPSETLPQWLALSWRNPVSIGQVELTFPGQLLQEINRYPAFYRDPECPKDYRIEAWQDGTWRGVLMVAGNYQRHVRHRLPERIVTDRLRIVFEATNGDPSAVVYEVRCYA